MCFRREALLPKLGCALDMLDEAFSENYVNARKRFSFQYRKHESIPSLEVSIINKVTKATKRRVGVFFEICCRVFKDPTFEMEFLSCQRLPVRRSRFLWTHDGLSAYDDSREVSSAFDLQRTSLSYISQNSSSFFTLKPFKAFPLKFHLLETFFASPLKSIFGSHTQPHETFS